MARAIDSEVAYQFLTEQLVKETGAFSKGVNKGLNIARLAMQNLYAIPTLTQPNEPLTFEERREMDRKPVWLDDEKTFGILQFRDDNNVDAVFLDPSGCICVKSVIGKKIYRRPPEGEEEN